MLGCGGLGVGVTGRVTQQLSTELPQGQRCRATVGSDTSMMTLEMVMIF